MSEQNKLQGRFRFSPSIAAVMVILGLILLPTVVLAANPPEPTYAAANVDGDPSEWDLNADFFAQMYLAAEPSKAVLSTLYLRYECTSETLYALVLAAPGLEVLDSLTQEHFIKLGNSTLLVNDQSGDDGVPPDFAWIYVNGPAVGWEASTPLAIGSYSDLNVHSQIDSGGSQTSAVAGRAIQLNALCSPTAVSLSGLDATSASGLPLVAGGVTLGLVLLGVALWRLRG